MKDHRKLLIAYPPSGAASAPPLLDYHTAFALDLGAVESQADRPIGEDLDATREQPRTVRRHGEHVHRLIERSVGIEVRAETHAYRLQIVYQLVLRKIPGAVERHVLHEVGEPELVVVLEHRSDVDDEPELGAALRTAIPQDEIAYPVIQRPVHKCRIHRKRGGERCVRRDWRLRVKCTAGRQEKRGG